MGEAAIIDVETLTLPISEDTSVGTDLRGDPSANSPYYRIRDARNNARKKERLLMSGEDIGDVIASWEPVKQLALKLLSGETKDVEICTWLIEALVRLEGFSGLKQGFDLLAKLVEKYWDELYPMPDEDGVKTRVFAFIGLNGEEKEGTLIDPIRGLVLVSHNNRQFAMWQYKQALEISRISDPEKKQRRQGDLNYELGDIERLANATDIEFFKQLIDDVDSCQKSYEDLSQLLDDLCGDDSPPTSNILGVFKEFRNCVMMLAKDRLAALAAVASQEEAENLESGAPSAIGTLSNREAAFHMIDKAANYFRINEPHSPLSYVLERVKYWGKLDYPSLMQQLVSDENVLSQIYRLTGMDDERKTETDD